MEEDPGLEGAIVIKSRKGNFDQGSSTVYPYIHDGSFSSTDEVVQ